MDFATKMNLNLENTIKVCGGNKAIALDIIQMMVNDLPQQRINLETAYAKQDWEELDIVSHKLAGSAAYSGMEKINALSRHLNTHVRQKTLAEIPSDIKALQTAIDDVLAEAHRLDIYPNS